MTCDGRTPSGCGWPGYPAEIVARTMGHRDTRMVERVYGRLSPEEIGSLLSAHFADCTAGVTDKVDWGGKNGRNGGLVAWEWVIEGFEEA